ncbi:hypothetical protein ABZO31_25975 [Streptomyces sp. HUAS MG47]|uniref:hypothetical protein n=1 Tax=Streptomyces solicamelliae TaxID=3231716 RepID=UPI003877E0E1
MIKHTVRALCAASLVIAPLALSTPAHAAVTCTVNGAPVSADIVNGTAGPDFIRCGAVPSFNAVQGLGGDDYIVITGAVAGLVAGGDGRDFVTADAGTTGTGAVNGNAGNDFLRVGPNAGSVNGGLGIDFCRVASGNPPVSCEG